MNNRVEVVISSVDHHYAEIFRVCTQTSSVDAAGIVENAAFAASEHPEKGPREITRSWRERIGDGTGMWRAHIETKNAGAREMREIRWLIAGMVRFDTSEYAELIRDLHQWAIYPPIRLSEIQEAAGRPIRHPFLIGYTAPLAQFLHEVGLCNPEKTLMAIEEALWGRDVSYVDIDQ